MVGSDDYSAAIGGGLKLKGSKPSGIVKKKKPKDPNKSKSKSKSNAQDEPSTTALQSALAEEEQRASTAGDADADAGGSEHEEEAGDSSKTEAEKKYEEMRRKRLDERLKKEGVKTHKQRVEELNKYLSTLSEHHDMPRIGPG